MKKNPFDHGIIDWPDLNPEQACVLWELVSKIADGIWNCYEEKIVECIAQQQLNELHESDENQLDEDFFASQPEIPF